MRQRGTGRVCRRDCQEGFDVGGKDVPATLPNPRIAELKRALSSAESVQSASEARFDGVVSAMSAQAWVSPMADTFSSGVAAQKAAVHSGCQGCVDNVRTALDDCPATITNPAAKDKH
jgi:hypothetical protein